MEVPHIIVVTKADMGQAAIRARADVKGALSLNGAGDGWDVPVLLASASTGAGLDKLRDALSARWSWLGEGKRLASQRVAQDGHWLEETLRDRFGREGLNRLGGAMSASTGSPFARQAELANKLLY